MAVSRRDKKRKEKLLKYKKSKKMSEKAPAMRPFRQIPSWNGNDKFSIEGIELEALYNFFNIFAPAFTSVQQVFARGVKEGKIKNVFEYEDGTLVPDEEIKAYTAKLNEYFKQRMEETSDVETAEVPNEDSGGKILNLHGVEATPDNIDN